MLDVISTSSASLYHFRLRVYLPSCLGRACRFATSDVSKGDQGGAHSVIYTLLS